VPGSFSRTLNGPFRRFISVLPSRRRASGKCLFPLTVFPLAEVTRKRCLPAFARTRRIRTLPTPTPSPRTGNEALPARISAFHFFRPSLFFFLYLILLPAHGGIPLTTIPFLYLLTTLLGFTPCKSWVLLVYIGSQSPCFLALSFPSRSSPF